MSNSSKCMQNLSVKFYCYHNYVGWISTFTPCFRCALNHKIFIWLINLVFILIFVSNFTKFTGKEKCLELHFLKEQSIILINDMIMQH